MGEERDTQKRMEMQKRTSRKYLHNDKRYEADPVPCSKCQGKYWEKADFDKAKQEYEDYKYDAHSTGWLEERDLLKTRGEVLDEDYGLYVKGSALKMNGEVTSKGKALGWVGVTWTKYHPEAEPQVPREKDPKYEWRTEKWKQIFVTNLYTDDDALELWHRKHNLSEEVPMEVDEMETLSKIDMEVDESILYVDCYNIQNFKDQREVTIQEIPEGVIINNDQWSWLDIQKVQAQFTQEP